MQNAYIVAGYRSAITKANRGGFRFMRPDDLAAEVIKHLLASVPQLDPERVDDLIVGNAVPEAEQGLQMGRMIALLSLPTSVSGMTVNRYCGSGIETIAIACSKIAAGMAECIVAGGTESMSLVPTVGFKTAPNYNLAVKHPEYFLSMGLTAEAVAKEHHVTREDQDEFSYHSHQKAIKAIEEGIFREQIVPVTVEETYVDDNGKKKTRSYVVDTDEGPRADTSLDKLAKLKPVFALNGTVTAGNASQTSDGAAFVIVMSERLVKELNLEPIARLVSYATGGVDPRIMGMGPIAAVPKAIKQAGLHLNDIDLFEINEAFAAQTLAVIRHLEIPEEKLNVSGGAIATGHPLGCSGAKLSIQQWHELRRRKQKYGLVTACVGGGQGVAGIYELLS
ncbi:MAG: 3-ketoacyl-CoA thiolase [fadN-fadA-fadE operon] [uncultured Adhaeribacter sp.]|uniref:acetyl-CoA C-acyltransferase n=1 Tax=uncultured Adhaeribacter sp. TaxID=448109 RepID=A0A6J4JH76_9BACT|nr:MAG: 3-ketoacyl-CoA thiolase [fadN-fadA-fadE operon] [uncultured Adhaeribacter sp.]